MSYRVMSLSDDFWVMRDEIYISHYPNRALMTIIVNLGWFVMSSGLICGGRSKFYFPLVQFKLGPNISIIFFFFGCNSRARAFLGSSVAPSLPVLRLLILKKKENMYQINVLNILIIISLIWMLTTCIDYVQHFLLG